jgi:hypothetical protein
LSAWWGVLVEVEEGKEWRGREEGERDYHGAVVMWVE